MDAIPQVIAVESTEYAVRTELRGAVPAWHLVRVATAEVGWVGNHVEHKSIHQTEGAREMPRAFVRRRATVRKGR